MKALILGLIVIIVAVFAVLPASGPVAGLGWGEDVLSFLRGALPVAAVFISLILLFVGISDIKERAEQKKEKEH